MKINKKPRANLYINIAPLVEVMLVLVIMFMFTVSALNVGVQVDLPKTQAGSLDESKKQPVILSIRKDGKLFIEDSSIELNDLIAKLHNILATGKTDTIYIRGDKDIPYGKIMEIMGVISQSGSCKVSLIAEPEQKPKFTKLFNKP